MKIHVRIVVRKAEPSSSPGLFSVHYGPDSFVYCENHTASGFDDLKTELDRVSELLSQDARLADWPGVYVAAENKASRYPNGWKASRHQTHSMKAICRAEVA